MLKKLLAFLGSINYFDYLNYDDFISYLKLCVFFPWGFVSWTPASTYASNIHGNSLNTAVMKNSALSLPNISFEILGSILGSIDISRTRYSAFSQNGMFPGDRQNECYYTVNDYVKYSTCVWVCKK